MSKKPELPKSLLGIVERVGDPVSPAEVDAYARMQDVRDRSHRIRTIVGVWKKQQEQERAMRGRYASLLIWAMFIQGVLVNVAFAGIGFGWIKYEPWTARAFILSVFAEISAMVFFIVKYLFRPATDKVLELAEGRPRILERKNRGS